MFNSLYKPNNCWLSNCTSPTIMNIKCLQLTPSQYFNTGHGCRIPVKPLLFYSVSLLFLNLEQSVCRFLSFVLSIRETFLDIVFFYNNKRKQFTPLRFIIISNMTKNKTKTKTNNNKNKWKNKNRTVFFVSQLEWCMCFSFLSSSSGLVLYRYFWMHCFRMKFQFKRKLRLRISSEWKK